MNSQLATSSSEVQSKIQKIKEDIARHDHLYYKQSSPEITDAQYDALVRELAELESQHPELKSADSPTEKVGSDLGSSGFKQVAHRAPMLSLSNCYSEDEFRTFDAQVRKELALGPNDKVEYAVELKIDGASISITYEDGKLVRAVTRGDGTNGDDVTTNVLTIHGIPWEIPYLIPGKTVVPGVVEIRGEIYCSRSNFARLNAERLAAGKQLFANPRNTASGSLKLQDPAEVKARGLSAFFYTVGYEDDSFRLPGTQSELIELFESFRLQVSGRVMIAHGVDEVMDLVSKFDNIRKHLDFDTDGIVIKVNRRDWQRVLGTRSKSPRWAVAWKYSAEKQETKVESVVWQVGRTGAVTPVANLAPVMLSGTMVRRATLHNPDEIERLGLMVGDTVLAEKAAEIIPKVVSVVKEKRNGSETIVVIPTNCPSCSEGLVANPNEAVLRCVNSLCPAQAHERIEHFASRRAMEIDGLGDKVVAQMIECGLIGDVSDLYTLTVDQLASMDRFGIKSAEKLIAAIDKSRTRPLARFIFALGIRNVGEGTSSDLAKHFSNFDDVRSATRDQFLAVIGIGEEIADSLVAFFSDPKHVSVVNRLLLHGVNPEPDLTKEMAAANRDEVFADRTFVLTGELESMGRPSAESEIVKRGGKASGSVSKKTYCVIVGASPGSKFTKAKELGITIWNEDQFLAALKPRSEASLKEPVEFIDNYQTDIYIAGYAAGRMNDDPTYRPIVVATKEVMETVMTRLSKESPEWKYTATPVGTNDLPRYLLSREPRS